MISRPRFLGEEAWHVASFMAGYPGLWNFSGGWAIDLFLGRRRRHHKDVDIAVLRSDQEMLWLHLSMHSPLKLVGKQLSGWQEGDLLQGPVFQVFAKSGDLEMPDWEFLLENGSVYEWVYRRDSRIRLPGNHAYWRTRSGIPFLAPEIVLLFKAKHTMPTDKEGSIPEELGRLNDEEDFTDVLPLLQRHQADWLADALTSTLPGHPWLQYLPSRASSSSRLLFAP